jgi:cytochrome c oxidase cbb3-type subunit 3
MYVTIKNGVIAKGMPAWEPVIGQKKASEVLAYILSYHKKGETITLQAP